MHWEGHYPPSIIMRKQSDKSKLITNCKTTGLDSLKMSKVYKNKKLKDWEIVLGTQETKET